MTTPPAQPKIYHITHVDNLASIAAAGFIEADGRRIGMGGDQTSIGMTDIKRRRLFEIEAHCHPHTRVGEYVPFYFCPRSIMLFIIYKNNHPDMSYRGGQEPILHLQMDMLSSIRWANENNVRWAFTDRNAGGYLADFFNDLTDLEKIDWNAVMATDFRDMQIQEGKQAEFLIHDVCPWHLVEKVGVLNEKVLNQVNAILKNARHKPVVDIEKTWYF
ncbi:MAG: DUF4433 domain-containing protein [Proteobacteria bacterium]|nr:DUF4433 domain-containing protein [Pseudomonadota bacterium]